jgi:hypothetical protein
MEDLPSLDTYPGGTCEHCGAALTFDSPPFCGACAEEEKLKTFDGFLTYALRSTVEGGSGRWPR